MIDPAAEIEDMARAIYALQPQTSGRNVHRGGTSVEYDISYIHPFEEAENADNAIEKAKAARAASHAHRILPEVMAAVEDAWRLSTWAGSINWRGGENQKEWLDELRSLIECFQSRFKALSHQQQKDEG